jgi:hypothetical protein
MTFWKLVGALVVAGLIMWVLFSVNLIINTQDNRVNTHSVSSTEPCTLWLNPDNDYEAECK